jgi:hypothetical protein
MNGEDYKIKTGKHRGKTLKEVPASYLIFCYEKGWLEDIARRFVIANEVELRKLADKK